MALPPDRVEKDLFERIAGRDEGANSHAGLPRPLPHALNGPFVGGGDGQRAVGVDADFEPLATDSAGQALAVPVDADVPERGYGAAERLEPVHDPHPPLGENHDRIADRLDVRKNVGREEDRFSHLRGKDPHPAQKRLALLRIEPGRGLVEDQQRRVVDDGLSEFQFLSHPRRVGLGVAVAFLVHAAEVENLVGPAQGLDRREAGEPGHEADHLDASQPVQITIVLRHVADLGPDRPKLPAEAVPEELASPEFARIALPDAQHAVYGKAGSEFLERSGLADKVRARLLTVATVPQVSAYLVSGEVDAGFINLTEALAVRDRLGGYLEIDPQLYGEIEIVGGVVRGREALPGVAALTAFLESPEAKAILTRHGL